MHNETEVYKEAARDDLKLNYIRKMKLKAKTLTKIEDALNKTDWSKVSPVKLLEAAEGLLITIEDKNKFADADFADILERVEWEA